MLAHRYLDDWLARRTTVAQIASHRFARLYPLHLYGLFGMLAFSLVRSAMFAPADLSFVKALQSGIDLYPDGRAYTFVLHLLLAQNIGLTPLGTSWHGPSWSISVEFFCPLLLFLFVGFWRPGTGAGRNTGFVAPTIILAFVCALSVINGARTLDVSYQNLTVWANYGVLRCLAELATGLVAYRIWRALPADVEPGRTAVAIVTIAEVLLLAGCCMLLFRRVWTSPNDVLAIPLFAGLVLMLATGRGFIAQTLTLQPFRWVGQLSYSVYINHFLVVMSLSLIIGTQWWLYSFFAEQKWPYFAVVLGLSWLTFTYIENPARRALNARLARIAI